jgi:mannan endo-1,4-beta-mannosidase
LNRFRALGACVIALVVACCVLAPAATVKGKKHHARPLYWGAQIGKQLTGESPPWDMSAITEFERLAGKKISVLPFSSPFADCYSRPCEHFYFPTLAMETLRQRGTIPELTWGSQYVPTPLNLREPHFSLKAIARGSQDGYIRKFARQVRDWGHPFFLRFNHEMNGFWFPWNEGVNHNPPGSFRKAWRHVHDIFTEVGATNATWVWCPNVDFTRKLTPLHRLYPGGRYVDWTCIDGFNWGDTANSRGWMSFSRVFHETYKRVLRLAPHKPVMIGEVASEERGGSKARWIRNTLRVIPRRFHKVRAVIWFEEKDRGMRWPIESSEKSRRAFARAIAPPIYRPSEFSAVASKTIRPPGRR